MVGTLIRQQAGVCETGCSTGVIPVLHMHFMLVSEYISYITCDVGMPACCTVQHEHS